MFNVIVLENTVVGEDYRDAIQKYLFQKGMRNSSVVWFKSIEETIKYAKKNRTQLLVFDQRLNAGELGTDAFRALREINNRMYGIFITAGTQSNYFPEARTYGPCEYVHKTRTVTSDLLANVEKSIMRYYTSYENTTKDDFVLVKASKFSFKKEKKMEFKVLSHFLDEDDYIPEDGWKVEYTLTQGIDEEVQIDLKASSAIVVSGESTMLYENSSQTKIGEFEAALKGHFETRLQSSSQNTTEVNKSYKKTLKGPEINPDTSKKYITAIKYESATTYKKYIVHCVKTCICCEQKTYFDYVVLVPNKKKKLKMVQQYSEGEPLIQYI